MTRETFAVALAGEEARGWLVDAESAGEGRRIVHGTVPRAHIMVSDGSAQIKIMPRALA